MVKTTVAVLLTVLVAAGVLLAQPPSDQSSEFAAQNLSYFAGSWSIAVHMKVGTLASRAFFATENNEWMSGRSMLVSRQEGDTVLGGSGLAVIAYDSAQKVYTYQVVNGDGVPQVLKGKLEGSTWTWTGDAAQGTGQSRLVIMETSPTSYTLKFETASGQHTWSTILEGKATKVIPHPHQDVAFLR